MSFKFCFVLFYHFYLFVDPFVLFMHHFPDFIQLSVCSVSDNWNPLRNYFEFFVRSLIDLFLWGWFLEIYFCSIDWAMFSWFFVCFVILFYFIAKFYAFLKTATSPSLYRLTSYRGKPSLISPGKDFGGQVNILGVVM